MTRIVDNERIARTDIGVQIESLNKLEHKEKSCGGQRIVHIHRFPRCISSNDCWFQSVKKKVIFSIWCQRPVCSGNSWLYIPLPNRFIVINVNWSTSSWWKH